MGIPSTPEINRYLANEYAGLVKIMSDLQDKKFPAEDELDYVRALIASRYAVFSGLLPVEMGEAITKEIAGIAGLV